jgi:uncharacterized membrane protein YphA (DoxX/SURF4 family)
MADSASTSARPCCFCYEGALGALLVRVFIGMILLFAGVDKFKSPDSPTVYAQSYWYGTKEQQEQGSSRMVKIVSLPYQQGGLDNPANLWGSKKLSNFFGNVFWAFGYALPWLMLGAGFLILVGLFTRTALALGGIIWLALAVGQALLPDWAYVQQLALFGLLTGAGLVLWRWDVFSIDRILRALFLGGTPDAAKNAAKAS